MTANNTPAIVKQITEVVASTFGLSPSDIGENDGPEQINNWDSLGHVRLMMEVEFTFSIRFSTDDINRPKSITEIATMIESMRDGE